MRALITGGTGFLGANLAVGLLARGWDVRILRRTTSPLAAVNDLNVEHAIGDVLDFDSLLPAMHSVDVVFNVAAISSYWRNQADLIYDVNVNGARHVFEAAARSGVRRVVQTSSAAAVGPTKGRPANENDPFDSPLRHLIERIVFIRRSILHDADRRCTAGMHDSLHVRLSRRIEDQACALDVHFVNPICLIAPVRRNGRDVEDDIDALHRREERIIIEDIADGVFDVEVFYCRKWRGLAPQDANGPALLEQTVS